jgi:hypothetical protein
MNMAAKEEDQKWVLAEKDGENDTREEDSNVRFTDAKRLIGTNQSEICQPMAQEMAMACSTISVA